MPKDGVDLVPLKVALRRAEGITSASTFGYGCTPAGRVSVVDAKVLG